VTLQRVLKFKLTSFYHWWHWPPNKSLLVCDRSRQCYRAEVDGLPTKQSCVIKILASSDLSGMLIALASHLPLSLIYFVVVMMSTVCSRSPASSNRQQLSRSTSLHLAVIALVPDSVFKLCLLAVRLVHNACRSYYQTDNTRCLIGLQWICFMLFTTVLVLLVTVIMHNTMWSCRFWI